MPTSAVNALAWPVCERLDSGAVGQPATVRLSAFDARTTPELEGEVLRVGADLTVDSEAQISYFEVRVAIPESEIEKLGDRVLRPGLPAEVFIATGLRTAASYLLQPFTDELTRAMRE